MKIQSQKKIGKVTKQYADVDVNRYAIQVMDLVKTYVKGTVVAVDKVSFQVRQGEIFGLIGPDGAGKTSIFRVLTSLLLPNGGRAYVSGHDVVKDYREIRKSVGYMPGKFSLYQDLSIEENLNFFASVFNTTVRENYHLIHDIYVQIEPFKKRRAGDLSGGMKQKLALCCALIHKPTVLFLDEPTTGVDPVSRKEFWNMLQRLKDQGITILVATPYMDEANLCDRIALLEKGKILSIDSPLNIVAQFTDRLFAVKAKHMNSLIQTLRQFEDISSCFGFGEYAHVRMQPNSSSNFQEVTKVMDDLKKRLEIGGIESIEIKEIEATIEDCFMKLLND